MIKPWRGMTRVLPKCFGSNPSYQEQAENDCDTCQDKEKCFDSGKCKKVCDACMA